jgi:hypothetical protein
MSVVGHNIKGFPKILLPALVSGRCSQPALAAALANPYSAAAEYILDNPAYGVDVRYLKSGGVSDPLNVTGNYNDYHGPDLRLDQIAAEINAGRPIAIDITWLDGRSGSHVVAIAGVSSDGLLVLDPANGQSVVRFGDFPSTYFNGAISMEQNSTATLSPNFERRTRLAGYDSLLRTCQPDSLLH